tara:strand:+ start:256 stop:558 length:303 start_codon:yes stop_codon:yes gene_type:complete
MIMLIASLILNVLLVVYIIWLLRKMWIISESFESILDSLNHFSDHLKSIHELEMFYGDETLGGLIEHSKEVVDDLNELEMFYSTEGIEEETDDKEETEEE